MARATIFHRDPAAQAQAFEHQGFHHLHVVDLDGAHAAAHGQRHEALFGGPCHDVEDGVAVLVARRDVEEGELVGAGGVVDPRLLDRIAGVAQIDELHALHHAAVVHVEARDDADLQHGAHSPFRTRMASGTVTLPS